MFSGLAGPNGLAFRGSDGANIVIPPSHDRFAEAKALFQNAQQAFRRGDSHAGTLLERLTALAGKTASASSNKADDLPPIGTRDPRGYIEMGGGLKFHESLGFSVPKQPQHSKTQINITKYLIAVKHLENANRSKSPELAFVAQMLNTDIETAHETGTLSPAQLQTLRAAYEVERPWDISSDLLAEPATSKPAPRAQEPTALSADNDGRWVRITRTLPDKASNAMPKRGTIGRYSDEHAGPTGHSAIRFEAADLGYIVHNDKDADERYVTLYIPDHVVEPYEGALPSHWPKQIGKDDVEESDFTRGSGNSIVDIEIEKSEQANVLEFIHAAADGIAAGYGAGNCNPDSVAFWWGYALPRKLQPNQYLLHIELDSDDFSDEARAAAVRKVTDAPEGEIVMFGKVVGRWSTTGLA